MAIVLKGPVARPVSNDYPKFTSSQRLVVRHPGYTDDDTNELLALVATDGGLEAPGVQYGLVHTACAIFAGNRFDGWLSKTRDATIRGAITPQDLLPVDTYYFHVPPDAGAVEAFANTILTPYPIVPNFHEWTFPHARTPTTWQAPSIGEPAASLPAKHRDGTCRVTNHREPTESAHIIPASEKDWFARNCMDKYNFSGLKRGQEVVNGDENVILLREDVHTQWDRMCFSFIPKLVDDKMWAWTVHVHKPSQELHALYHNLQLQPLTGVRHEYLFARFAWDLFPLLQGFLQRMKQRRLKLRSGVQDISGLDCKGFCEGQGHGRSSPSRSTSRKSPKRKHGDIEEEGCEKLEDDADSAISGIPPGVYWKAGVGGGDADSEDDDLSSVGKEDPFGVNRRKRQAGLEAELADSQPISRKRQKRALGGIYSEEYRGRARVRRPPDYGRKA